MASSFALRVTHLRIGFVIPSLGPGGAERVASLLANDWAAQGHEVTLATFEMPGAERFFALNNQVEVHGLAASDPSCGVVARLMKNSARVRRLRSLLRELKPDAVVAFMTEANVVAVWACQGLDVPVVISERNQPDRPGLGITHKLARRLSYPFARAIVVQTRAIAAWAEARFRIPVHIIPNPVVQTKGETRGKSHDVHRLISIGRLTHQKGYDILIRSFSALANQHPEWQLVIYGDGPDRQSLERLRAKSGCKDRISLPGLTRDSLAVLRQASLFVLPSRFEGYPNTLLEALGSGLPVVATSCPGGSTEILANGVYGLVVPPDDISALAVALGAMMSDPSLRHAYASRAQTAVSNLEVRSVGKRWLDLLASL